jgi:hypothetical protein
MKEDRRNIEIYNRIRDIMEIPESCEHIVPYCLKCAFADWSGVDKNIQDDETMCIIAYNIRSKINCPFYKHGGRKSFLKKLYSVVEDEKRILDKAYNKASKLILYGYDPETAMKSAFKELRKLKSKTCD